MVKKIKVILQGAGSILDIYPNNLEKYRSVYPYRSETDALREDWERIGNDIRKSMAKIDHEQKTR